MTGNDEAATPFENDAVADWSDEIRKRADRVASGEFEAVDWRDSVEQIRTMLSERGSVQRRNSG